MRLPHMKITIVTVCFNSENTIENTIRSVVSQSYSDIEYIIVDGLSTDNTLQIVNRYSDSVSRLISERDSGIYEAMNKGVEHATGDFILFLNADDRLIYEKTIENFVKRIEPDNESESDVRVGNVIIFDPDKNKGHVWKSKNISPFSVFRGSVPHPATFYRRDSFTKNGLFDESFKIAGDYEWLIRAVMKTKLTFTKMDILTAIFFKGGISTRQNYKDILSQEKQRAIRMHYSRQEIAYYNFRFRIFKTLGI
ncbi:MAG: glycosyltransferase family 2 protein [Calditrichia bacterium]